MGWAVGYDQHWRRDIGYGVPAICDHPGCGAEIDRGLSYVCGGEPYGGDDGCGLFFCQEHLQHYNSQFHLICRACAKGDQPFTPTPDTAEWLQHKLTDSTWADWREAEPEETAKIAEALGLPKPQSASGARSEGA